MNPKHFQNVCPRRIGKLAKPTLNSLNLERAGFCKRECANCIGNFWSYTELQRFTSIVTLKDLFRLEP